MAHNPTLYARGNNGKFLKWKGDIATSEDKVLLIIRSGIVHGKIKITNIEVKPNKNTKDLYKKAIKDLESRYNTKLQGGYCDIALKGDITPALLDTILPKVNLDLIGMGKPMKGQKFKHGVMTYPAIAQPKINGFRGRIRWETRIEGEGMFATEVKGAVIRSFDGIRYHLPHITNLFKEEMFEYEGHEIVYDGEIYRPFTPLNEIKKRIPYETANGHISTPSLNPEELGFWMFDLAIPDVPQNERISMLKSILKLYHPDIPKAMAGYVSNDQSVFINIPIVSVYYTVITSDESVQEYANLCIEQKYEGAMIRDFKADYQFGGRKSNMLKVKKWQHTECEVLDIILVNEDNVRTYINFKLKNDKGSEIFECNCEGDEAQRQDYLINKTNYIGKLATIRYRERSGVNNVPFQAVVEIIDRKSIGDI